MILCWLLGVAAQVVTAIEAPRAIGSDIPPIGSTIEGYVLNVGMTLATTHIPLLGMVLVRIGWWIGFVGVAAILAVAAVGIVKGSLMAKVAIGALLYGSVVSWSASFVLGRNPAFFYSEMDVVQLGSPLLARWGTAASMLLAATIPVTVAVMVQRYPRWRVAWLALLAVLALALVAEPRRGAPRPGKPDLAARGRRCDHDVCLDTRRRRRAADAAGHVTGGSWLARGPAPARGSPVEIQAEARLARPDCRG